MRNTAFEPSGSCYLAVLVLVPGGSANNLSTVFEHRFKCGYQLGIAQKFVSQIEGFVELPFGSGHRLGKVPFLQE